MGASTLTVAAEKPQTVTHIIVPSSGRALVSVKGGGPLHKLLGITREEYESNTEDYSALVGASPARVLGLEVALINLDTNDAEFVRGIARLAFMVHYYQPTPIAQS
jgi:hypothetical protein